MLNFQDIFHVGIRVPDIYQAMEELGESLGLTWTEVVETSGQRLWTPESGQQEVPLKFVYSCEGPQHLELLEGEKGSFWDGTEDSGGSSCGSLGGRCAIRSRSSHLAGLGLAGVCEAP